MGAVTPPARGGEATEREAWFLNCAEGAGRVSRADKARVFAIARGEAVEAVAAVEIAAHAGDTTNEAAERCVVIGNRVVALLTGFIR
ncbi:MAG: hypothetical protein JWP87_4214 [Labilithrix sp.]|nr:hypothetical protein [Labilithrix sp.]